MTEDVLYIDNSTLSSVACSTEAVMRHVHGMTSSEERAYLKAGTSGHAAVAAWFKGAPKDEALDVFAYGSWCETCGGDGREYTEESVPGPAEGYSCPKCSGTGRQRDGFKVWADENQPPGDRLSHENTSAVLSHWLDTHPVSALPVIIDPALIEVGFAFPLHDPDVCGCGHKATFHGDGPCGWPLCICSGFYSIVFCGRIDGLVRLKQTGDYYVWENKFPGNIGPQWARQFYIGSQLSGYQWAAEQHTSIPVMGSLVNACEFSKLPSSERKCTKHAVDYAECGHLHAKFELLGPINRTPEALVTWRKSALVLARRFKQLTRSFPAMAQIERVPMEGTFFNRCQFCAMFEWCRTGRQLALVPSMLAYEPWRPYDYSQGITEETAHKP